MRSAGDTEPMPEIRRSALVGHAAARMFALVNDVSAYPRRFAWCDRSEVLEAEPGRMVARLDLRLVDGPFRALSGRWEFHALDESACKVTLTLVFEPMSRLLAPAMTLGFQALADRMVDDFVRVADRDADVPHA